MNINQIKALFISFFKTSKGARFTVLFVVFFLVLLLVPLVRRTMDFSIIKKIGTFVMLFLYMLVIIVRLKKLNPNRPLFKLFSFTYSYAICLYVAFSIICIVFPQVYKTILNIVSVTEDSLYFSTYDRYVTRVGWIGFSGFTVSLKCSVANVLLLNEIATRRIQQSKISLKLLVMYLLTLLGTLFYARTGFVICLSLVVVLMFYLFFKGYIGKSFVLFCSIILIFIVSLPIIIELANTSTTIRWSFELILNYLGGSGVTTTTTTILSRQIYWPGSNTFFFGDGFNSSISGNNYKGVDVGYMRMIFYFGIFGVLLALITFGFSMSCLKSNHSKWNFIIISLFLLVAIFEIKGETILTVLPVSISLSLCNNYDCSKRTSFIYGTNQSKYRLRNL